MTKIIINSAMKDKWMSWKCFTELLERLCEFCPKILLSLNDQATKLEIHFYKRKL